MIHMRDYTAFEMKNLEFLSQKSIEYTTVQITDTGFEKSILDATAPMRQYFKDCKMYDYGQQEKGPENKVSIHTVVLDEQSEYETTTSLYRPKTKNGDPRILA